MDGNGKAREQHNAFGKVRRERFLEALRETCNVTHSAERAGVWAATAYKHYHKDADFAADWNEALQQGYLRLEEKLLARALGGMRDGDETGASAGEAGEGGPLLVCEANHGGSVRYTPFNDTRLALALLNRHRGSVETGRMATVRSRWTATSEDTDAALWKQLEALARKLAAKS